MSGQGQRCAGRNLSVILLAAGRSTRMLGGDKLLMQIGGVPAIGRSFALFQNAPEVCCVAVVVSAANREQVLAALDAGPSCVRVIEVPGGDRRQDSVFNGLRALDEGRCNSELVAVHDGARPLADSTMLETGSHVASIMGAAVPVVPIADTLKRVQHGTVIESVPREEIYAAQTPQVFKRDVLMAAHEAVSSDVTDDAAMVEQAGGLVSTYPGDPTNIKLTTASDVVIANALVQSESVLHDSDRFRHGIGYDVHRLVPGGPLKLGGVEIEFGMHLKGHSDGDVLMHAVASAILGAVREGDMGSHFPSSDSRYLGVDSAYFVERSVELAAASGWRVAYVDSIVIAARPRMSPHYGAMVGRIAVAASLDVGQVNVKSTTTDGVGGIGAGEGIGAQVVATVVRSG